MCICILWMISIWMYSVNFNCNHMHDFCCKIVLVFINEVCTVLLWVCFTLLWQCTFYVLYAHTDVIFKGVLLLLCNGVLVISNVQDSDMQKQHKPIGNNATVWCPGCNNGNSCHVNLNNVTVDKDDYVVLENGSLFLPANNLSTYGKIDCGGSSEESMKYLICPPNDGMKFV